MALERRAHTRPSPARERPLGAWGLTPRRVGGPPRWRGSLGRGPGWSRRCGATPSPEQSQLSIILQDRQSHPVLSLFISLLTLSSPRTFSPSNYLFLSFSLFFS